MSGAIVRMVSNCSITPETRCSHLCTIMHVYNGLLYIICIIHTFTKDNLLQVIQLLKQSADTVMQRHTSSGYKSYNSNYLLLATHTVPAFHKLVHLVWPRYSVHTSSSVEQPSPQMHHPHAVWSPFSSQAHREIWNGAPHSPAKEILRSCQGE